VQATSRPINPNQPIEIDPYLWPLMGAVFFLWVLSQRVFEMPGHPGNFSRRVACFRCALEEWTREKLPRSWAVVQIEMGSAHARRVDGTKATNMGEAVACYNRALEVWTRESQPRLYGRCRGPIPQSSWPTRTSGRGAATGCPTWRRRWRAIIMPSRC